MSNFYKIFTIVFAIIINKHYNLLFYMFDLSMMSKDKVYLLVLVAFAIIVIIYIGNKYIKDEIKRGVLKDKHRRLKKEKKNMMNRMSSQEDTGDDDMDSYINPVVGIDPMDNDNFAQFEDNNTDLPKRFGKNDIGQREMLENIRK
jgi:hypothetical protein